MTAFCRHPGCLQALSPGNVSGVCKMHMHGDACRCRFCRAPRKASGKRGRPRTLRIKTRPELEAEGLLLPGLTLILPLPKKGTA
jgi:hypothetical protein